jgi:hypothetical protein
MIGTGVQDADGATEGASDGVDGRVDGAGLVRGDRLGAADDDGDGDTMAATPDGPPPVRARYPPSSTARVTTNVPTRSRAWRITY